jgi:hypothetical protein
MFLWKLMSKKKREFFLDCLPVADRGAVNKVLSGNARLPRDFKIMNCLFIHNPKTGGSNLKRALFKERINGHLPFRYYQHNFPEFCENAYKFSVVRHPVTRAYSAWSYLRNKKLSSRDAAASDLVNKYLTFDEFVLDWLTLETVQKQIHFAPQWVFLTDSLGSLAMDFVGRQERLAEDFTKIAQTLNVRANLQSAVRPPEGRPQPNREKCSKEALDRIVRVYERDFNLFGYNPEDSC